MKKIMFLMPLLALSFLASCGGSKPGPTIKKWYEHEDWWNYCSNGNADSEATSEDIGKEVNVTVYEKVHKVRLIDVDHIEPKETVAQAHCTFEFMNVITDSNGAVITKWDEYNNYNFPDSTLNKYLNGVDGDITGTVLEMLPRNLRNSIKEVNKKVGLGSSYSTKDSYKTKLFPLAHDEMADNASYVAEDEGAKYQYYKEHTTEADRIKREVGSETEDYGEDYWLRSPSTGYSYDAWRVSGIGGLGDYSVYDDAFAVAPAFCI